MHENITICSYDTPYKKYSCWLINIINVKWRIEKSLKGYTMLKKTTLLLILFIAALHMEWGKDVGAGRAYALCAPHETVLHSAPPFLPEQSLRSSFPAGLPHESELAPGGPPRLGAILSERAKPDTSSSSQPDQLISYFLQAIPYANPDSLAPVNNLHLPDKRNFQESPPPVRAPTA